MATDLSCVFCKIVAGQIPSFKVYEDDVVLAFLDVGPLVRGHTLVVPKAHHATVMETPEILLGTINQRLPKIAKAVIRSVEARACHILTNNGPDAQQSVPHLHYHIIPRMPGDAFRIPWVPMSLDKSQAALAAAIGRAIGA